MAAPPPKAVRSELVDEAHDRLRELIVSGRLPPGSPIIETEVAAMLGVNRSHLRSAMQRLQQSGFVVTAPIGTYSRSKVAPLLLEDVGEVFQLVGAVEGVAARGAARLPERVRRGLVRELREINEELLQASEVATRDLQTAYDLDIRFHLLYVEQGGGERLQSVYAALKPQADRYERLYTHVLIDQTELSVREHESIAAAIQAGDAAGAQRAVEQNWMNAAERFKSTMGLPGEQGKARITGRPAASGRSAR